MEKGIEQTYSAYFKKRNEKELNRLQLLNNELTETINNFEKQSRESINGIIE